MSRGATAKAPCHLGPRTKATFGSDALLSGFFDTAYAYRFGPPKHDVVVATLLGESGEIIAEAFRFPGAVEPRTCSGSVLSAEARAVNNNVYEVTLISDRFLYAAHFDAKGFVADDNYFHLMPGRKKIVQLKRCADAAVKFRGYVEALNLDDVVRIVVQE